MSQSRYMYQLICIWNRFRKSRLYVHHACMLCMYSVYVFCACILCMYSVYVFCVCILCMYSVYVLRVCILCMYSMCWLYDSMYVFHVCSPRIIPCMYSMCVFHVLALSIRCTWRTEAETMPKDALLCTDSFSYWMKPSSAHFSFCFVGGKGGGGARPSRPVRPRPSLQSPSVHDWSRLSECVLSVHVRPVRPCPSRPSRPSTSVHVQKVLTFF